DIDEKAVGRVILLGGGVLMPGILEGIKTRFGTDKVIFPDHPEEIVVRGIGLAFTSALPEQAAVEYKHKSSKKTSWRMVHENGTMVEINKEIMIAGRSREADIHLDSKKCSRTHALIRLEGKSLTLLDLNSKNGTVVNDTELSANTPQLLREGDEIRFGDQQFTIE
ncbi:MAG: FHA domain-containing protein, partial [Anaerolineales bacterium]|nr:FHA domain-containing protein [Anaerolineales bacterium]